jgi:hypothetical protein
MDIKRLVAIILLVIAVGFFWVEIFLTMRESKVLAVKNEDLMSKLESLSIDKNGIQKDINYYSDPSNLEKLLRGKFDYKMPGEGMIIVVPQ